MTAKPPRSTGPSRTPATVLGLDPEALAACVQCGLCLPHCPTFRTTGDEAASPRGRIALMRLVEAGTLDADDDGFVESMGSCVQCRGCEPACPSGVGFGHLMEATREALAPRRVPRWQRAGYAALGHHRLLVGMTALGSLAQRAHLVPSRLVPGPLPLRQPKLRSTGSDVWLFTGCVMDAWQRDVHAAAVRVLGAAGAAGVGVALPDRRLGACCGALHTHAGLAAEARRLARRTMSSMPGDAPIVVDSAGCGAALLDYGHLLGTDEARTFSARVRDIHTHLAGLGTLPPARRRYEPRVAIQDPCHLRHVQRAHGAVRDVLAPYVDDVVELDDDGLCCGAGGAYSALHPADAEAIRARKLAAIARSGAAVVASANPGCSMHLAAAGVVVVHPIQLIDQALRP